MKFRAVATRLEAIQVLIKSLQASCKLTPNVVFRVGPTGLQVIADPSYRNGPLLSRCELLRDNLFTEYSFNGISAEHNLIFFDLKCDSLAQVLSSLQSNIKSLKIKLANGREGKFLMVITVEYPAIESSRLIVHNVYISIMNRKYWSTFDEEQPEPFQISFYLPNFKTIASNIERLASIAQYAMISGKYQDNDKAYFTVGLASDHISVKSKFNNLELNEHVPVEEEETGADIYKIRLDIKKLNQVFSAVSLIKPTPVSCSIAHMKSICFHFFHELANFKIFLPHYHHNEE